MGILVSAILISANKHDIADFGPVCILQGSRSVLGEIFSKKSLVWFGKDQTFSKYTYSSCCFAS